MQTDHPPDVQAWFDRRTYPAGLLSLPELLEAKSAGGLEVSVCLPVLNEESTIGEICRSITGHLIEEAPVVDELIVVDSGSTDRSVEIAEEAGATVFRSADILPGEGHHLGKGEAMWKSLAVATGDIIVWLDSDVTNFDRCFVTNLLAPLLLDETIVLNKGFYDRKIEGAAPPVATGGRVTELVVRPLIHLLYPPLAGFVQPLSGEYAGRREAMLDLEFPTGYAVEIGLLLDLAERYPLDALAQADLGLRVHRNRDTLELGRMAHEIMQTFFNKLEDTGRIALRDSLPDSLVQFIPEDGALRPTRTGAPTVVRPPMREVLP